MSEYIAINVMLNTLIIVEARVISGAVRTVNDFHVNEACHVQPVHLTSHGVVH